jgi:hypothetical protein
MDLENLVIRARNELGIEIRFPDQKTPEDLIRPRPSHGYSQQRFAVADLMLLWEDSEFIDENGEKFVRYTSIPGGRKFGTFVYVKSSVTAPNLKPSLTQEKDKLKFDTYKYKIYHPAFPHESTGDQFFDPVQWESYFQLGQHIGADVLGLPESPENYEFSSAPKPDFKWILAHFDENKSFFEENNLKKTAETAMIREENAEESFTENQPEAEIKPEKSEVVLSQSRNLGAPPQPMDTETGYRM